MARRSYHDQLRPRDLVNAVGRPVTINGVRKLLEHAANARQRRDHHETGAYIEAARLALDLHEQELAHEFTAQQAGLSAMLQRLKVRASADGANANSPSSPAALQLGANGNNARPGRDVAGGGNGNSTPVAGAARAGANANWQSLCFCGHATISHTRCGEGLCTANGCRCQEFQPVDGE